MTILLDLLKELGFHINWGKVEGPNQDITFSGIHINSVNMCIGIPRGKIVQIQDSASMQAGIIYLRSLMEIKLFKRSQHKTILFSFLF